MDGKEDNHITPPPPEKRYVRRARDFNTFWNLVFPPVVGVVVVVLLIILALRPELRDSSFLAVIGSALLALAGLGLKKKP